MTQRLEALTVEQRTSAADVRPAPSRATSRHVRLTALPSAVPWARRVLGQTLREWQLHDLSDTALLLVSELVTNAVQASVPIANCDPDRLPMIALSVHITGTRLVMEVWDASPSLPALREADLTGDRGRGLLLVDFLADEWGHYPADGGKVVWCALAIPERTRRHAPRSQGLTTSHERRHRRFRQPAAGWWRAAWCLHRPGW